MKKRSISEMFEGPESSLRKTFEEAVATPKNSEWEEEFDSFMLEEYGKWKIGRKEAKDFIRSLLQERSKEVVAYLADQIKRFGPLERIEIIDSSLHLHHNNPTPYDPERSKDTVGELRKEIEGMQKKQELIHEGTEYEGPKDCWCISGEGRCEECVKYEYNSALKSVLTLLSEQIEQK